MASKEMIIIGDPAAPLLPFRAENDQVRSVQYTRSVDIVGEELTIDTLTAVVDNTYEEGDVEIIAGLDFDCIISSDGYTMISDREYGDLRTLPYGTPVYYYDDTELKVKAYTKNVDRIGPVTYRLNCISAVGLLENQRHFGGLYTGQTFGTVLAEIIDDIVPYTVDADVASIQIFNWLPVATRRSNLHELLFSSGVMVGRNNAGDMHFQYLTNDTSSVVPPGRIYINGSIDYSSPASMAQITEHSYIALAGDEVVTEYDNTDGSETANNTLLIFQNAPLHDLTTTGTLTISDSDVNWAIISGTGTLTGKKYTHSTRVLSKISPTADDQIENVAAVEGCTLINVLNSQNVAQRVLDYYSSKKTVSAAIAVQNEAPGMLIQATDAFLEPVVGYISSINALVSATTKGECKIITDYVPANGGNNFTQAYLYTGSGTVDLSALVAEKDNDLVQVVLIGGGHGGYSGEDGTAGTDGSQGSRPQYGTPGVGGAGGQPGEGGKIYTVTFSVSALAVTVMSYTCGTGGLSDLDGSATTFGGWSSDNGDVSPYGVANIFSGAVYGMTGESVGQPGGRGSGYNDPGPNIEYNGQTWTAGAHGSSSTSGEYSATGGWGGGAAVGSNGGDGEDSVDGSYGDGGDGANGAAGANGTGYGQGGCGGHGGGGAGVGGVRQSAGPWYFAGPNGAPGQGGAGGQGGPGLMMIYA